VPDRRAVAADRCCIACMRTPPDLRLNLGCRQLIFLQQNHGQSRYENTTRPATGSFGKGRQSLTWLTQGRALKPKETTSIESCPNLGNIPPPSYKMKTIIVIILRD
jgi:hypothetical protein